MFGNLRKLIYDFALKLNNLVLCNNKNFAFKISSETNLPISLHKP